MQGPQHSTGAPSAFPVCSASEPWLLPGGCGVSGRAQAAQVDPGGQAVGTGGAPQAPLLHGICLHCAGRPGIPGTPWPFLRSGLPGPTGPKCRLPQWPGRSQGPPFQPSACLLHSLLLCFPKLHIPTLACSLRTLLCPTLQSQGPRSRHGSACSLDGAVAGHWLGDTGMRPEVSGP